MADTDYATEDLLLAFQIEDAADALEHRFGKRPETVSANDDELALLVQLADLHVARAVLTDQHVAELLGRGLSNSRLAAVSASERLQAEVLQQRYTNASCRSAVPQAAELQNMKPIEQVSCVRTPVKPDQDMPR